ncbi:hypothetical protein BLNAU_18564 [Blattamonas nauphoetae]|uniref:Uncharacterized protein n=1 Tax=Blattamonas nauphoetae TaxID=2049346 RepID=A0ABQ9X4A5_9EUKA|nr:hypothetical protein BLNAU_18564 [Blattamonas nauphoetae]
MHRVKPGSYLQHLKLPYSFHGESYDAQSQLLFWGIVRSMPDEAPSSYRYSTSATPIVFSDCEFVSMGSASGLEIVEGGSAICVTTQSSLFVERSLFRNCTSRGSGGAILVWRDMTNWSSGTRIVGCNFTNCSSEMEGGAVSLRLIAQNEIQRSFFEDCMASMNGGGCQANQTEIVFCRFEGNNALAVGGGVFGIESTLTFSLFKTNVAPTSPDWAIEPVLLNSKNGFGCTRSEDDWDVKTNVLFVESDGSTGSCTLNMPCNSISAAFAQITSNAQMEIWMGKGDFGEVSIDDERSVSISRLFSEEDWTDTKATTSFSITVSAPSTLLITNMPLDVVFQQWIVNVPPTSGGDLVVRGVEMLGEGGFKVSPFIIAAGNARFENCLFQALFGLEAALIEVEGWASVTIVTTSFSNITSTNAAVSVNTASIFITKCKFYRIHRTEGDGPAGLEMTDVGTLVVGALFHFCLSDNGIAGAMKLVTPSSTALLGSQISFLGNKGKSDEVAHDLYVDGITWADTDPNITQIYSKSDFPHLVDSSNTPSHLQNNTIFQIEDDDTFTNCHDNFNFISTFSRSDFMELDLNSFVSPPSLLDIWIGSIQPDPLCFQPLAVTNHNLRITTVKQPFMSAVMQAPHSTGTLFTLTDSPSSSFQNLNLILDNNERSPFIKITRDATLGITSCLITSETGQARRSFVESVGTVDMQAVTICDIALDQCSLIQTQGGDVRLFFSHTVTNIGFVSNVTTTGNGSLLNARDTLVYVKEMTMIGCKAAFGGVLYLRDCPNAVLEGHFFNCSASEAGGGICVMNTKSNATNLSLTVAFENCSAVNGGCGFFWMTGHEKFFQTDPDYFSHFGQLRKLPVFKGCSATRGAGFYFAGKSNIMDTQLYAWRSSNFEVANGSDFYFSQIFADSAPNFSMALEMICANSWSFSGRSKEVTGSWKTIRVEGYPELGRNIKLPQMVLMKSNATDSENCENAVTMTCASIARYLPLFHTKSDNNTYFQVLIFFQGQVYFSETGIVREQSVLITKITDPAFEPVTNITVARALSFSKTDTCYLRVEKDGELEISNVTLIWALNISLCANADKTAKTTLNECVFRLNEVIFVPFLSCIAGSLDISNVHFKSVTSFTHRAPVIAAIASDSSVPLTLNFSLLIFEDITFDASIEAVVCLDHPTSLSLFAMSWWRTEHPNGSTTVYISVRGEHLQHIIQKTESSFPNRGNNLDHLYTSLDLAEDPSSVFYSPTLLLYLSRYSHPIIDVKTEGRDIDGCGDYIFPCLTLEEANLHLEHGDPSQVIVYDQTQLTNVFELTTDSVEITAAADLAIVEVGPDGSFKMERQGFLKRELIFTRISFELQSGRTQTLVTIDDAYLFITSCHFNAPSEVNTRLVDLKLNQATLSNIDLTSCCPSEGLFDLYGLAPIILDNIVHSACPAHTLIWFRGEGLSRHTLTNSHFTGAARASSGNAEDGLCDWTGELIVVEKCFLAIEACLFTQLSSGAFSMIDSDLNFEKEMFVNNSVGHSSFPSMQKNIRCVGASSVRAASISSDEQFTQSFWIQTESCAVRIHDFNVVPNPFFVPDLIPSDCSVTHSTKTQTYSVSLKGTLLIPCGLSFVVCEGKQTDGGNLVSIQLSLDTTTQFNETDISIDINEASLSSLSSAKSWMAYLAFGKNGTTKEFGFSDSIRKAFTVKGLLVWLIPVIVGVVVIVFVIILLFIILWWRRKRKREKEGEEKDTVDEEVEGTDEAEGDNEKAQIEADYSTDVIGPGLIVAEEGLFGGKKKEEDEQDGRHGGMKDENGERRDEKENIPIAEDETNKKEDIHWTHAGDDSLEVFIGLAERKGDEKDEKEEKEDVMERPHKKKRKKKTTMEEDEKEEEVETLQRKEEEDGVERQDDGNVEGKKKRKKKKKGAEEQNDRLLIVDGENNGTVNEVHMIEGKEGDEVEGELEVKKKKKKKKHKKKQEEIEEGENMRTEEEGEIEETRMNDEMTAIDASGNVEEVERPKRKKKNKKKVEMEKEMKEEEELGGETEIVEMGGEEVYHEEEEGTKQKTTKKGRKKRKGEVEEQKEEKIETEL